MRQTRCDLCGSEESVTAVEHDRLAIVLCAPCREAGKRPTIARRVVRFLPADTLHQ